MRGHTGVIALVGTLLLGSCGLFGLPTTYLFKHNATPADPSAGGNAVASVSGSMVSTVLSLSGLTPGRAYIAHYHAFGPASNTDPCGSNGPVTVGFPDFTADASGHASVTMRTEKARIEGDKGAYINVHFAGDPSVVPICAPVKPIKG